MALVDFAPTRYVAPSAGSSLLAAAVNWFIARRTGRAQEAALQSLLFAPEHRLRDLGISRAALMQALDVHRK